MRIVILGSSGMLGSMLEFYCHRHGIPSVSVARKQFDVLRDSIETLEGLILQKPTPDETTIVNCIGAIPQKRFTPDEYVALNETFPQRFATWCQRNGIHLVHVSTNCVFSGLQPNRTEDDVPDALDLYGQTKRRGEPSTAIVVRCSIVGFERETASGLLEWFLHSSGSVTGYTDSFWNGLTTWELSRRIIELIATTDWTPITMHFHAANTLSKYQILCFIRDNYRQEIVVTPKEAGLKHYTLATVREGQVPSPTIEHQLHELFAIEGEFRAGAVIAR